MPGILILESFDPKTKTHPKMPVQEAMYAKYK